MRKLLVLLALLMPIAAYGAQFTGNGTARRVISGTSLPAVCSVDNIFFKTDATAGENIYLCTSANTWTQVTGSGGTTAAADVTVDSTSLPGTATDVQSALADACMVTSGAGAPSAGTVVGACHIYIDTSTTPDEIYFGKGTGSNFIHFGEMGDAINQVCFDADCETAVGGDTLTVTSTSGLLIGSVSKAADTITIDIDIADHVKSIYLPANALTTDGTQCANPALATINSGPRIWTIICTENDASTIYGHVVMPDSWNGGTFTVELEYVQTAADTGSMLSDVAGQCRGPGETINNTWGTEQAIDDAAVTGSNAVDHTTSAAITADGTCAGGDSLFIRWQVDGTANPTTAAATLNILGMKVEYTVNGSGTD